MMAAAEDVFLRIANGVAQGQTVRQTLDVLMAQAHSGPEE
jgi:hypothetical protein